MDSLPATYRLADDYQIYSLEDGLPVPGWNNSLRTEEIGEGCCINLIDCRLEEDESRRVEGPPTFSISLFLEGAGRFAIENGPALDLEPRSMFLFHTPQPTRGLNQIEGGKRMLGADFRFAPAMLDQIGLHSLGCLVRGFFENASVQDSILMRRPLTDALQRIAEQTIGCNMRGLARRAYMQSKALEVLAHLVAFADGDPEPATKLTPRDRARVQQAAEMLRHRYSEAWTIGSLARAAGINERKLKQGFREVLGQTVHSHLEQTRISAAKNLLRDQGLGVTETALAVGYSNPSHFAKIFKRSVGASPSRWLRRG